MRVDGSDGTKLIEKMGMEMEMERMVR
jgi:hypothetical protein